VVIVIAIARADSRSTVRLWRRRIVRLVSCKFRGTARKSGVHTRTAYKLIPLCRAIEEEGRRAEGKVEERDEREREREREELKKNWLTGLITSPGPGLTLGARLLGPATESPTTAGWRLVPRDFSSANRGRREKTQQRSAPRGIAPSFAARHGTRVSIVT